MFTKENTARATHIAIIHDGFRVYDLSSKGNSSAKYLSDNEWHVSGFLKDTILAWDNIIELARPQSDIDALFNDAPDWVTGYGSIQFNDRTAYYWLGDSGFTITRTTGINDFNTYGSIYKDFEDFTIIATRPPVEEPVIATPTVSAGNEPNPDERELSEDKPVYTQAMADAGEFPEVKSDCQGYIFANTKKQGRPFDKWVDGVFIGKAKAANGGYCIQFKDTDGVIHILNSGSHIKPMDNRTDREKAINDLFNLDEKICNDTEWHANFLDAIIAGKIHGIEYTGIHRNSIEDDDYNG